ncbi:hypothetical protein AR687_23080 [Flavobacteriaceae bacterium CRH]|uniref:transposase n=1 Tax=Flavobacterium pectinovorum TaxID=29533 RepID=UPI00074123DB|nr:hypothetical protein AR687_23080 [Flavobacteriaceae bacterium CRH]
MKIKKRLQHDIRRPYPITKPKTVKAVSCFLLGQCFKGQGNRSVERDNNLERHKQRARELLLSEIGIQRRQRSADVEPVFAELKHNNGFRRFSLKELQKVELEFGLMALGHNLRKKIVAKRQFLSPLKIETIISKTNINKKSRPKFVLRRLLLKICNFYFSMEEIKR